MFESLYFLILSYLIVFIILSNSVGVKREKTILVSRCITGLIVSIILLNIESFNIYFFSSQVGIFGGLFSVSNIANFFLIFILLLTCLILQLTSFYPRKISFLSLMDGNASVKFNYLNKIFLNTNGKQYKIIEYPLIMLFIVLGAGLLMFSNNIISLFLSLELQSYGLYILCTLYRDSERSVSGGLLYFLLGGLSSCIILLGLGLLYANSGVTNFEDMYLIYNLSQISNDNLEFFYNGWYLNNYVNISLIIISVGFLFKISAAPFHFWSPDVYDQIPTVVTTFVAIITKISILVILLGLVHHTTNFFTNNLYWTVSLLISSILSLIIGAVLGLTQFRIKRLYAYSTISHLGFILIALVVNSVESIQSFIFYLMQYSLSNLNAFLLLIIAGYSLYNYKDYSDLKHRSSIIDKSNSPVQLIKQLKGFFYINAYITISLSITLFSFAGIPPLVGFFGKQMILSSALDNGYIFVAIIGILSSVVSAYYYLTIVKEMFFTKSNYNLNTSFTLESIIGVINNKQYLKKKVVDKEYIGISTSLSSISSFITLIMLVFIITPNEWLNIANMLALTMFVS